MDVNFTLWSLHEVLAKIPFDDPPDSDLVDIDFSEIAAPYYVKNNFKASIIYEDSLPYEACCSIYSPKNVITIVIIIKRIYETYFKAWKNGDKQFLKQCCFRRELYCHEACHLIAIIRAFPSDRSSIARDDFIAKIKEKFSRFINTAEEIKAVPLISAESQNASPSIFDKEHFRYGNDSVNYFGLFQELMLPYDRMVDAVEPLCRIFSKTNNISFENVAQETLVSQNFFDVFPEKLTVLREMLSKKIFGE
jgi:hypothetical protein